MAQILERVAQPFRRGTGATTMQRATSSSNSNSAPAAARTSPRLDASAAFFAGVPAHAVHACASYSAAQPVPPAVSSSSSAESLSHDSPALKRFLLTASAQGELVHWTYLASVGYTARALLIPPTSTAASGALVSGGEGHRRSHWQPSLPGSSLACSNAYPAPTLSSASCVVSTRVANKDVFVVADRCGGVSQWSVDGDCCFCAARLCPFPVTQLRIVHSRPYGAGSAPITYAICGSDVSNTVCIIDLLQMHVVRYIDIDSTQAVQLPEQPHADKRREVEGPQQPLGVACMDLRSVACHDSCMVPSLMESDHLVLLSTRGRISIWDLTSIIRSTMQLSSDASSSRVGSLSESSPRPTKRRVNASMSGAFFASLPPLDVSHHSACISAPLARLSFLASPLVSMRVFSAPMPAHLSDVPVYNTVAFILLVMQRHFIVLHADTYAPVIPLQTLRDLRPKTPQPHSPNSPAPSSLAPPQAAASSSSTLEVPTGWSLPLPVPPLSRDSSKRNSLSVAPTLHAHEHTVECQLLGGQFLFPPQALSPECACIVSCAEPPSFLLWSSCGCAWVCAISPSSHPGAPLLQRQHSAPTAAVAPISPSHQHDAHHSTLRVVTTLQLPRDALISPSTSDLIASGPSFCAHVPETSGDLFHPFASDASSLSLLFGTRAGHLLEYALPLSQLSSPLCTVLQPKHVSHFTDAFATPSYLHRFMRAGVRRTCSSSHPPQSPTLPASLPSSCSSLVFDLLYHRDDGMKSLLVLLVQGFDSGRMHFFKLLNSAVPAPAGSRTPHSPVSPASPSAPELHAVPDTASNSDSFHALQAHSARVTAIVSFQAAESLFAIPLLVSASLDGSVAMWEARTANLLFRLHAPSPILDLTRPTQPPLPQQYPPIDTDSTVAPAVRTREGGVVCSDTTLVCAICADLSVRLLSVEKMGWVACLRGHDSIPRAVFRDAWSTSADVLLVQTARGSIFIWSVSSGTLEEVLEGGADDGLEFVWRFPMFAGAAAPLPKLTPSLMARNSSGTPAGCIPTPLRSRVVSNATDYGVPDSPTLSAPRRTKSNSDFAPLSVEPAATATIASVVRSSSSSLQGISELTAEEDLLTRPPPQPSRSPPPAPAPAHSTAILSSSSDDPNLTPPRMARAATAPNSRRPTYLTPIVTSVPSAASPQSSGAAAIPWAVHYGLQRLWKLGGRGGLWGAAGSVGGGDDGASGSNVLQSASFGGSSALNAFGASSNLVCSFESLPALHLHVLSVDIGFLTAEMRQQYAPLNATSDRSVAPAVAVPDGSDAPLLTLETKHRAEVYKEIFKLLLDWSDDDEPMTDAADDEDKPAAAIAQSSRGVPGSRLSAKTDLFHILRDQFHMRPPFSGSRDRVSSAHEGSLPTCYASYSPTNNALSILLPRACCVRANRELVASASASHSTPAAAPAVIGLELSHLARWSIGPNFTATHSLCLTTVLLSLLGSSDIQLHNYYSLIENFYNATLPALQPSGSSNSGQSPVLSSWRYTEADLPFLASYALHEHDDIRRASKLLIQGLIGRVSSLSDLESWSREWGSFYEQMGQPPALPWLDTSMADPTAPPTFPAPPRLVSDFEFMTCMILCYLQQAAAKKRAALALSMHREAAQQDAAAELQIQSHIRAASVSSSAKAPSRRSSLEHAPVISLDSTMLPGLSLKVQPSPPRRMQSLSSQEAKRDGESRSVIDSEQSPARLLPATLFPAAPVASAPLSVDRTPFIVSTLLRLLSQTHQDSTIHSLQKSSICVELLIQGLTVSSHSLSAAAAAARATDEPIPESNPFWQQIPKHALEPLYRILFDLSFVQPARDAAGSAAALSSSGRRPSNSDLGTAHSSPVSLSSTCRVLLFELAKFDLHTFIQWARCEMFGYPGLQSGSGVAVPGTDFNGADLPTAPSQIKKSVAAAAAAAVAAVHDPSVPLVDAGSSGYASLKALQFDEYRVQLVSMLVTLPRKFSQRMSYAITRNLVELLIQLLDPMIVAQTRTAAAISGGGPAAGSSAAPGMGGLGASAAAASAASSAAAAHAAAFPHSLRTRLQQLISPLWPYLSGKFSWLAYSVATNKLALVENPRWLFSDRLSRLSVPAERRMFLERDGVALLAQEPSIPVYDLSYASRWRTLDGCCAPFSDIDAISFSANGHLLASYSPHDGQTATIRVWSTDYESAGVGSGFFGTRLLMKAVFKVHPFCLQTIQLPAIPKPKPPNNAPFTSALLGLPQGPHQACNIRFNDLQHIRLTREDETTVTLTLAV